MWRSSEHLGQQDGACEVNYSECVHDDEGTGHPVYHDMFSIV